jgi:CcmD family protein
MESIMRERVRTTRSWLSIPLGVWLMGNILAVPALLAQQPPPPSTATPGSGAAQEGFVPVENLPQQESIPAPRLVATAYACVWIVLMAYLYSIWRRLGTVQRELESVSRRLPDGPRPS